MKRHTLIEWFACLPPMGRSSQVGAEIRSVTFLFAKFFYFGYDALRRFMNLAGGRPSLYERTVLGGCAC